MIITTKTDNGMEIHQEVCASKGAAQLRTANLKKGYRPADWAVTPHAVKAWVDIPSKGKVHRWVCEWAFRVDAGVRKIKSQDGKSQIIVDVVDGAGGIGG